MIRLALLRRLTLTVVMVLTAAAQAAAQGGYPRFHFKPADHAMGDAHPFFENGECFLYYLKTPDFAVQLVRSRDLLRWTPTTLTLDPTPPADRTSNHFVLGVIRDPKAGVFRSFFEVANGNGRIASSVSQDLVRWSPGPRSTTLPPDDYYTRRTDPFVFWDPDANEYGCVLTTRMKGLPDNRSGAISYATSPDLLAWTARGAIFHPGDLGTPECPQMFRLGRTWYLLASVNTGTAVGQPSYWRGERPAGPWPAKRAGVLDGADLCAAQVAFDGDRPVLFGWIPLTPAPPRGRQHWGGHLALPREVYARPDGSLAVRLHPGVADRLSDRPAVASDGFPVTRQPALMAGFWEHFQIEAAVALPRGCRELKLTLPPLGEVTLSRETRELAVRDPEGRVRRAVPVDIPDDRPLPLRVVCDGDIVEVFFDDRYALAARLPLAPGPVRIGFSAAGADAAVGALKVSKLNLR